MAKDYEGDREFGQAAQFDHAYRTLPDELKSAAFVPLAESFAWNVERCVAMCALPIDLVGWAAQGGMVAALAQYKLGLPIVLDDPPKKPSPELVQEFERIGAELNFGRPANPKAAADAAWARGTVFIKQMVQADLAAPDRPRWGRHYVTRGVDAILAAMVTGAYAAFETLASDLWISALDSYPRLAANWARKTKRNQSQLTI